MQVPCLCGTRKSRPRVKSELRKQQYTVTPFDCNLLAHVIVLWPMQNLCVIVQFQGAKKIIFTACHLGKLKLEFTSPDFISTSPKSFLTSRIDFTVLLLFEFLKEHHLPVGQVKNRLHQPASKIHQPRAIGHHFLCMLSFRFVLF